ncbi:DNA replication/repair protein RecF [Parendozoicomonas sp. Alg238-R29]|uniref:DNA replication/repair protein RecF n=1 Tax=Parendozoicomonas sp. Alg238-R29 TaxID=2993446 RepID=UPI00248F0C32|nr:DNA replication/repair protein RecF [Parendozoicomonas sp. Alg238-R29]
MSFLQKVRVTDIRNLVSVTLSPSPSINILYGSNGSGKTSFLEAVHLLGTTRSFRSSKVKPVIRQSQEACTVFGLVKGRESVFSLGVSRSLDASCKIHINGEPCRLSSDLASILPLQVINPDTFRLLEGTPKDRRQFLDWGVFHVEHRFLPAWKRAYKSMKQRNALLRHGKMSDSLMDVWDAELSQSGEEIDNYRRRYFEALKPVFENTLECLSGITDIQISYSRGWDKESSLRDVLKRSYRRDVEAGYTQWGPHRADIKLRYQGLAAVDTLSRGQQKAVVCALKLAQGKLFSDSKPFGCVYLVDDLPSELDQEHRSRLCKMFEDMNAQVFITCVDKGSLGQVWSAESEVKMFHVEHGVLIEDSRAEQTSAETTLMDAG